MNILFPLIVLLTNSHSPVAPAAATFITVALMAASSCHTFLSLTWIFCNVLSFSLSCMCSNTDIYFLHYNLMPLWVTSFLLTLPRCGRWPLRWPL